MGYKVKGNAEMSDASLVRAHDECRRLGASPTLSMVKELTVTLVTSASLIPFE